MKRIVILASALSLMIAVHLRADAEMSPQGETSVQTSSPNSLVNIDPTPVWVVSPWGYGGFFLLHPGINHLQCPVTGQFFEHVPA